MFGVGPMELLILGGVCFLFVVGLIAVVVVMLATSNKKSNDE